MIEFNFKSQVATTIEQSERLIALGLKKETADMTHHYLNSIDSYELKDVEFSRIMHLQELVNKKPVLGRNGDDLYAKDVPAWSLHRLIEILDINPCIVYSNDVYGNIIDRIEDYIKERIMDTIFLEEHCLDEEEEK